MNPTPLRLAILWGVGIGLGTLLIAVTSPWFVRSYLPLQADSMRGVWTLPAGTHYRWRSEGYADSRIGPYGMPGKASVEAPDRERDRIRVALWGDSQAEGVCLPDVDKLFAQMERESAGKLDVFPLARSGEDAADWVTQMDAVEKALGIDHHVVLVAELSDLLPATEAPVSPPSDSDVEAANRAIASRLPAFVIQAARFLLREDDGATPRRLRFGIGPVVEQGIALSDSSSDFPPDSSDDESSLSSSDESAGPIDLSARWHPPLSAIRAATDRPITLLYAPLVPLIADGRIRWADLEDDDFQAMRGQAEQLGLETVDARTSMRRSAEAGRWPHGFHNGQIGVGHLNRVGNEQLALEIVPRLVAEASPDQATESNQESESDQESESEQAAESEPTKVSGQMAVSEQLSGD